MPTLSVTVTRVEKSGGQIHVRFGKEGLQFASLREMRAYADAALTPDVMKALAVRALLAQLGQGELTAAQLRSGEGLTLSIGDATGVSRG